MEKHTCEVCGRTGEDVKYYPGMVYSLMLGRYRGEWECENIRDCKERAKQKRREDSSDGTQTG